MLDQLWLSTITVKSTVLAHPQVYLLYHNKVHHLNAALFHKKVILGVVVVHNRSSPIFPSIVINVVRHLCHSFSLSIIAIIRVLIIAEGPVSSPLLEHLQQR